MLARSRVVGRVSRLGRVPVVNLAGKIHLTRLQSTLPKEPNEILTQLGTNDPKRNEFFQYSWGSWIKDDKLQKSKRATVFSIEGISTLVKDFVDIKSDSKNFDRTGAGVVKPPTALKDGSFVLTNNMTKELLGDSNDLAVKSIASIHEGKHHRVYKVSLSSGKDLVLRIPYKLESDFAISQKIKSEAATLDFLNLKLGLNVPKVIAYSATKSNMLESPYILMEYVPGDLLMKSWNPLLEDSDENIEQLKSVIKPIVEFQDKVNSVVFNKFGSLYFHDDVPMSQQSDLPYDGETNPLLKNRWRIGSSIEKVFAKNKNLLSEKTINQYNGPWDASKPEQLIESVADIELENAKNRLSLSQADASHKVENVKELENQITTFEHLKTMASKLINPKSSAIMNVEDLFKPRLSLPDLDPLNVIMKDGTPYFVDFEYACIKPFILTNYPIFVAYNGGKVFDLEQDVPEFDELEELEQQQYKFMYLKTRNERLWESELNNIRHDLIAVASPHMKALKSPYLQALELKTDKDYLYVESSIVQLQAMWDAYVANELCNSKETEFPIKYDERFLDGYETALYEYQMEHVSAPFAATGGWVPQDMFANLKDAGVIVEDGEGNYKIVDEQPSTNEKEN
jgi:predicted Ser/Thr protein kinase